MLLFAHNNFYAWIVFYNNNKNVISTQIFALFLFALVQGTI